MPKEMIANIPPATKNIYDPPDVFNPLLHPPLGEVDVLSIVEAGPEFQSTMNPQYTDFYERPSDPETSIERPGRGIHVETAAGDDFCDGTVDSFCKRGPLDDCLLRAHNDGRNGLKFDGFSGWVVMKVPNVVHGHILVKFEHYHKADTAYLTEGWTSINNESHRMLLEEYGSPISRLGAKAHRALGTDKSGYCDEFHFEYSVDGNVTSLDRSEYYQKKRGVQRVVEVFPVLNNPGYTNGIEKDIEVAIRITGCGRTKTFLLTHVYWA